LGVRRAHSRFVKRITAQSAVQCGFTKPPRKNDFSQNLSDSALIRRTSACAPSPSSASSPSSTQMPPSPAAAPPSPSSRSAASIHHPHRSPLRHHPQRLRPSHLSARRARRRPAERRAASQGGPGLPPRPRLRPQNLGRLPPLQCTGRPLAFAKSGHFVANPENGRALYTWGSRGCHPRRFQGP